MKCTGRHAAGATFCAVLFALGSVSAFSAAVEVPGDRAWTDTGIDLAEGETFRMRPPRPPEYGRVNGVWERDTSPAAGDFAESSCGQADAMTAR